MRIAIIGSRGVPANYSGVERAVEEVSKRLVKKGHAVIAYCRSGQYISRDYQGIERVVLPTLNSKNLGTIVHVFLSTLAVLSRDVDIVHYHALGPSFFSWIPRLFGKKVVVTIHALDWQRKKWGVLAKLFLKFCQFTSIYCPHRIVVVSLVLKQYFERKFHRAVQCINNGVDLTLNDGDIEPLSSGIERDKYILFVGRLVPEKGLTDLIKAINELKADVKLVVAGESSFTDSYVRYLHKIAGSRISFVGFVDGLKLKALYQNALLVVLPSEVEGAPLVLFEAMVYGKCVLSSDLPACQEILGDCGEYFKVQDQSDLRNKLELLINSSVLIDQLGEKAKIRVVAQYNWEKAALETEQLYLSLLGG